MGLSNAIQLLYGIPGVLIYFVVIYAMLKMRKIIGKSFLEIYVMTAATVIISCSLLV